MRKFTREAEKSRVLGNLAQCHDCGGFGYIVLSGGEVILPPGWRMAWVGLKLLYICGGCAEKRRKMVLK